MCVTRPIFEFGHGFSLSTFKISASPSSCGFPSKYSESAAPCVVMVEAQNVGKL